MKRCVLDCTVRFWSKRSKSSSVRHERCLNHLGQGFCGWSVARDHQASGCIRTGRTPGSSALIAKSRRLGEHGQWSWGRTPQHVSLVTYFCQLQLAMSNDAICPDHETDIPQVQTARDTISEVEKKLSVPQALLWAKRKRGGRKERNVEEGLERWWETLKRKQGNTESTKRTRLDLITLY